MLQSPLTARLAIADGFLDDAVARALRADIDRHFADPGGHQPDTHQVWNYWHVPGTYTYMRTQPEKVLAPPHLQAFLEALRQWSTDQLGLAGVTHPYLSLYVDGCVQELHNDSLNGRFGYVFSLTLDQRKTIGGETIVLREGDLFRENLATAAAGSSMFDLIEPRFNRLAIFDDRVPHGVRRIEGSMDPREGRLVLHGHLHDAGILVAGPLPAKDIETPVRAMAAELLAADRQMAGALHGLLVPQIDIDPEGNVIDVRILVDRLARNDAGDCRHLSEALVQHVRAIGFPKANAPTRAKLPLTFGAAPCTETPGPSVASVGNASLRRVETSDADDASLRAAASRVIRARLRTRKGLAKLPSGGLEIYALPDFLSPEECDRLMALIDEGRFPSGLIAETDDKDFRTSDSCNLELAKPMVQQIEHKITELTGIDPKLGETIQGQRYAVGQRFKPHHDFFHTDQSYWDDQRRIGGQRTWTAMVFLNSPDAGGDTRFPSVDVTVKPRLGALLIWNNLDVAGQPNHLSLHEGMPVEAGVKYIITKWYRERPWG